MVLSVLVIGIVVSTLPTNILVVSGQSITSSIKFSISGNQTISHRFNVSAGDTLSLNYNLDSSNETTCVTVTVSSENSLGFPQLWQNRSSLAPYSHRSNGTSITAIGQGTLDVTYDVCPQIERCKGQVSISVSYSVELASLDNSQRNVQQLMNQQWWFIGGLVVAVIAFLAMTYMYATKLKQQPAPMGSPNSIIAGP